jgi:hypothetical protein
MTTKMFNTQHSLICKCVSYPQECTQQQAALISGYYPSQTFQSRLYFEKTTSR